ncbi:phage tail protein [Methylomonas fluvii]|uniref:Tail fiber protein n=1 Tax=Methylomonas fluvii TaxID=1854564 RepID=A0ABR9DHS8_9GAMM|nr:tail fiber protein [Methylomonas fluvii]MBD9362470.1 tail fiber protein [Methylomonas fluvii]
MSEPFIGEIRPFAINFVPMGWLRCNGQQVAINQYQALYAVISSIYGGDNQTYFNVPNLNGTNGQSMMPMLGMGQGPGLSDYQIGEATGQGSVALTQAELPAHAHSVTGINAAATSVYSTPIAGQSHLSRYFVSGKGNPAYSDQQLLAHSPTLAPSTLSPPPLAQGQAHDNHQPYLAVIYAIAWDGIFPSRN